MSSKATPTNASKPFPGQHDGEHVELVFRQHPLVMRKALIFGMVAILAAVSPLAVYQVWEISWLVAILTKVVIIVPIVVVAVWFWRWVGWYYTVYIVTNERIVAIRQKGLFNRSVSEWQLDKIMNVNYTIGGLQAVMFSFGDIMVQTVVGDFPIPTVHQPLKIHEQLQAIVRRNVKTGPPQTMAPWLNR